MSFSFVDDEEVESPENKSGYSFVDEESSDSEGSFSLQDEKDDKSLLRKVGEKALSFANPSPYFQVDQEALVKGGKAILRGVGTTVANLMKESVQPPGPGSLPHMLWGSEERPEPELATKLRKALPDEGETFGERALERTAKIGSDPRSLIFGAASIPVAAISGVAGQAAEDLGAPEWLQTTAEVLTPILSGLGAAAYKNAKPQPPASLTRVGGKLAKAEVITNPVNTQKALNNIAQESFTNYEKNTAKLAESNKNSVFDAREIANNLNEIQVGAALDTVSPPVGTNKQFGELLQTSLNNVKTQAESQYKPLYKYVEETAEGISTSSESTIKYIDAILEDIDSLETKPKNYEKVRNDLIDIQVDLGKKIKEPKTAILDQFGNPIEATERIAYEKVPLSKKIKLNQRLSEIIDYDIPEYSIKDRLKPVKQKNKESIRNDLRKVSPEGADALDKADQIYGETAERFKRKSVQKIMKMEATEKINAIIDSPTTLEDLRNTLNPADYAVVERQVIEKINDMPFEKATNTLKEVDPYLSNRSRAAGESIVRTKDPLMMEGNWNKQANGILLELQESFGNGTRPENTLKLMQTKKGYKTVYQTLHSSKNGQKALKTLQKQYVDDMVKSTLNKDGSVNFEALANMMNSSETNRLIVRQTVGAKGLKEAEMLSRYAKNVKANFDLYGPKALKDMGLKEASGVALKQGALPLVSFYFGGLPLLAVGATANQASIFSVYLTRRILASPKAQAAFRELAHPKTWKDGKAESVAQAIMIGASKEDRD